MFTRTALASAPHVQAFCREINRHAKPVRVPITPTADAAPLDCFHNVRRKVARENGEMVYGWAIWEWPGFFIEAEHHAIHLGADGQTLTDPTPSQTGDETERLFLPDPNANYDFDNEGQRRDNRRKALMSDPLLKAFFEVSEAITQLMNSVPGVGMVEIDWATDQQRQSLEYRKSQLMVALLMKHTPRNAPCFCGSGRKFKACHARLHAH